MKQFIKWAEKEYGLGTRILATLMAGVLFVVLIPLFLSRVGPNLDNRLGLPSIALGLPIIIVVGLLTLIGLVYALWSIVAQLDRARGTPLPMMATKKLLISGPFRHCRNPMTFGTILLYLGLGIILGSISAVIMVLVFVALLIIYIKQIEEQELEARFGEEYLSYKQKTPFLIPKIFSL